LTSVLWFLQSPGKAFRLAELDQRKFLFVEVDHDHSIVGDRDPLPAGIDLERIPLAGRFSKRAASLRQCRTPRPLNW